jgi:hypothetical protein
MPKSITKLQVFVASPGDVQEERDCLQQVVDRLNRGIAAERGFVLELVRWETHAWPAIGSDVQDVINRELGVPDIFVGIMWKRFGTPTLRTGSGTAEEFDRAFELWQAFRRVEMLFYFNRKPFYPNSSQEVEQISKVLAFRQSLTDKGVLFAEYDGVLDFERKTEDHLTQVLRRWQDEKPKAAQPPLKTTTETNPLERMLQALGEEKFRWRSVERLAILGGVSESEALELLRSEPEVVLGRGVSGRRIARLRDR